MFFLASDVLRETSFSKEKHEVLGKAVQRAFHNVCDWDGGRTQRRGNGTWRRYFKCHVRGKLTGFLQVGMFVKFNPSVSCEILNLKISLHTF